MHFYPLKLVHFYLQLTANLSQKLLRAHADNAAVTDVIQDTEALKNLMLSAQSLTKKLDSDPLEYVFYQDMENFGGMHRGCLRILVLKETNLLNIYLKR